MQIQATARESEKILRHYLARLESLFARGSEADIRLLNAGFKASGLNRPPSPSDPVAQRQFEQLITFLRDNGRPEITLELFSQLLLPDFGLYGYALASSDTLERACETSSQYLRLTSERFQELFYRDGDRAVLECLPNPLYRHQHRDIAEEFIAGNWRGFQLLMPDTVDFSQVEIHLNYPAPDYHQHYRRLFNGKLHFNGERIQFTFPAEWLSLKVVTADADLVALCERQCENLLQSTPDQSMTDNHPLIEKIRNLVLQERRFLMSLEDVAERFFMSPRTLRQHLYQLDTSFRKVVLDLRMQMAKQYLESTPIPIKEIAYLLNYSQPSAFQRAFKAYFNYSPKQVRVESGLVDNHKQ